MRVICHTWQIFTYTAGRELWIFWALGSNWITLQGWYIGNEVWTGMANYLRAHESVIFVFISRVALQPGKYTLKWPSSEHIHISSHSSHNTLFLTWHNEPRNYGKRTAFTHRLRVSLFSVSWKHHSMETLYHEIAVYKPVWISNEICMHTPIKKKVSRPWMIFIYTYQSVNIEK